LEVYFKGGGVPSATDAELVEARAALLLVVQGGRAHG